MLNKRQNAQVCFCDIWLTLIPCFADDSIPNDMLVRILECVQRTFEVGSCSPIVHAAIRVLAEIAGHVDECELQQRYEQLLVDLQPRYDSQERRKTLRKRFEKHLWK